MPRLTSPSEPQDPLRDPLLADVPTIEGHKVLGKTILLDVLGAGGMGVVYRGWHMTFHIDVAVKVLQKSLAEDRDYVRRFRREAQAALKITHQNVVRAYDVEELHGLHFFVMEFVDGESAWQRVGRLGRLSPPAALTVFAGAATGLAEAHAHGLVHRDVKPSNLLIARSGRVKLADLGLVHPAVDEDEPAGRGGDGSSRLLGTPQYLAPELWDGAPAQPSADVWALGATLYYLVTGRHGLPRLPKADLRQLVREQPFPTVGGLLRAMPELDAILERCVRRDPAARFQHAGELSQALLALGPGDEEMLREGTPPESAVGRGLPPNEVLGRIDMHLRGRAPVAAVRPSPTPAPVRAAVMPAAVVMPPRRRMATAPARQGLNGIVVVVVLAVVAILVSLFYLAGRGRRSEVDEPTTEQRGAVDPAPVSEPPRLTQEPARPPQQAPPPEPPRATAPKVAASTVPSPGPAVSPPAVEASAPEPPLASPRETLRAWLAANDAPTRASALQRHRDAFRLARAEAGDDPAAIDASLAPFDEAMARFPDVEAGSLASVDPLVVTVGSWRRQGVPIEPLLPWLQLLRRHDPADPGAAFCEFEAWAVDGLDLDRARRVAGDVQKLLASVGGSVAPSRARLPEVVFELGALGDDGPAMLAAVLRHVVAERLAGPLGPRGMRQAFVPALESAYEEAMQGGDFDRAERVLQTLCVVDPTDRGAEVLLAAVRGNRDSITFDFAVLAPEEQGAVVERARCLGLELVAPQLDVPAVLAALGDTATAPLPFFVTGLADEVEQLRTQVTQLGADIQTKQAERSRARTDAEAQEQIAANNRQRNPAMVERALAEAKRLRAVEQEAYAQVEQLRKDLLQAKRDLSRREKDLGRQTQERRAFQLPARR